MPFECCSFFVHPLSSSVLFLSFSRRSSSISEKLDLSARASLSNKFGQTLIFFAGQLFAGSTRNFSLRIVCAAEKVHRRGDEQFANKRKFYVVTFCEQRRCKLYFPSLINWTSRECVPDLHTPKVIHLTVFCDSSWLTKRRWFKLPFNTFRAVQQIRSHAGPDINRCISTQHQWPVFLCPNTFLLRRQFSVNHSAPVSSER